MKVEVNNLTEFSVDEEALNQLVQWLMNREPLEAESVSVAFVGDERMKEMNETFYNEEGTTDVLTFDYEDGSIEIVLNPYQHDRQAPEVGNTTNEETIENFIHGYLHACDYDHLRDDGEHLDRQRDLMNQRRETAPSLIEVPEDVAQ